jgi:hypothetical protein
MRIKMLPIAGLLAVSQGLACAPVTTDEPPASSTAADAGVAPVRAMLDRALSRSPHNLRVHTLRDGTEVAEVVGGFQHATVVRRTDAGLESHCLTDADEAARLLEGRAK